MSEIQTESRKALTELISLLQEVDGRWASPEWNLQSEADVVGAHRAMMHMLEGGLVGMFESDPASPVLRRIVSPTRKFTGDNADAIYFDAPVSNEYSYRVRGQMNGAVYVSLTVEMGTESGLWETRPRASSTMKSSMSMPKANSKSPWEEVPHPAINSLWARVRPGLRPAIILKRAVALPAIPSGSLAWKSSVWTPPPRLGPRRMRALLQAFGAWRNLCAAGPSISRR